MVPLKEYFEQTAKEFVQKEAEKNEETAQKKREYAKLTPCADSNGGQGPSEGGKCACEKNQDKKSNKGTPHNKGNQTGWP